MLMTVLYWGLGGGCALLTCLWALYEIHMRMAEKKFASHRLQVMGLGGSATVVTLMWALYLLYLGQP